MESAVACDGCGVGLTATVFTAELLVKFSIGTVVIIAFIVAEFVVTAYVVAEFVEATFVAAEFVVTAYVAEFVVAEFVVTAFVVAEIVEAATPPASKSAVYLQYVSPKHSSPSGHSASSVKEICDI
jgi:hypothetical protein